MCFDYAAMSSESDILPPIDGIEAPSRSDDWSHEPLSDLIETGCSLAGGEGENGALMADFIACRILSVERREEDLGFVLIGFARLNAHLLPGEGRLRQGREGPAQGSLGRCGTDSQALPNERGIAFRGCERIGRVSKEGASPCYATRRRCVRELRNPSEYGGQKAFVRAALYCAKGCARLRIRAGSRMHHALRPKGQARRERCRNRASRIRQIFTLFAPSHGNLRGRS